MDHISHNASTAGSEDGSPVSSKKRKAGASGRGVASLTAEQLAKKRANDREAQRAIRERTKATIDSLERRIQELTSQQPYQELQAVIRQKEAIQAENDEIRRRLTSILSIIQPVVGAQGLTDLASAASHNVELGFPQGNANVFQQDHYLNNSQTTRSYQSPNLSTGYATPFGTSDQDQPNDNRVWSSSRDALNQQRDNLQRILELNESGERLSFNFLLDGHNSGSPHPHHVKTTLPQQQHVHLHQHQASPSTTSLTGSLDHPTAHGNRLSFAALQQHQQQQQHQHQQQKPIYMMLPQNCPPVCPLDGVLLNFLQDRKRNPSVPPAYPSVSSLLNPASSTSHPIDPLSQLMTDIISKFPNISGLPEQVAVLFFMFLFVKWQIYPTQENYERLPEWMTPRPSQLFTAHPAWIDHIVWPRMRDKVIANYQDYPFENWFLPFTSGMSVNWPYEPVDCLLSSLSTAVPVDTDTGMGHGSTGTGPSSHQRQQQNDGSTMTTNGAGSNTRDGNISGLSGDGVSSVAAASAAAAAAAAAAATAASLPDVTSIVTTMNPVFERHIRRLENWSLGPQFAEAYPDLVDTTIIRRRNDYGSTYGNVGVVGAMGMGGVAAGGGSGGGRRGV